MQISFHAGDPLTAPVDLIAVGVGAGVVRGARSKSPLHRAIDKALGGVLAAAAKEQDFTGKKNQQFTLHSLGKLRAKRIASFGLGKATEIDRPAVLNFGANVARLANRVGAKRAIIVLPSFPSIPAEAAAALLVRGAMLGGYKYTEYKSDKGRKPALERLVLAVGEQGAAVKSAVARAAKIAEGVSLARDLVNQSPLQLYPETLAARAASVGRKRGLAVKVLKPAALERLGMKLILGVGAGSTRPPRLVHLTYTPNKQAAARKKPIVLVGKGITFDSGGLSLKPSAAMVEMKSDMHGAATVLATMEVVARLAPPRPVHGILALAENMPSGAAIRPGDIIRSAAGKTVEITNTDAEGRLVLADALHYATKLHPAELVDLATLTGACVVALGQHTVGLFANDDALADALQASAVAAGEDLWRLPLSASLESQLESDAADMKNTGERWGGAITAALFLREFVGKAKWAHLDIAGPATTSKSAGLLTKGGTGVGVATLVEYIATSAGGRR